MLEHVVNAQTVDIKSEDLVIGVGGCGHGSVGSRDLAAASLRMSVSITA